MPIKLYTWVENRSKIGASLERRTLTEVEMGRNGNMLAISLPKPQGIRGSRRQRKDDTENSVAEMRDVTEINVSIRLSVIGPFMPRFAIAMQVNRSCGAER